MTVVTGTRAVESGISEKEWTRILQRIEGGKVIPVIGEHLSVMPGGDAPGGTSLASYLAKKLELTGPPAESLNEVAFRYLQVTRRGLGDLYAGLCHALPP